MQIDGGMVLLIVALIVWAVVMTLIATNLLTDRSARKECADQAIQKNPAAWWTRELIMAKARAEAAKVAPHYEQAQ